MRVNTAGTAQSTSSAASSVKQSSHVSQKSQASQNDNNNLKTDESEMNIKIPRINCDSPNFKTECEQSIIHSPDSAFRIDNNNNETPYQTEFKLELKDTNVNHIIDQVEEEEKT